MQILKRKKFSFLLFSSKMIENDSKNAEYHSASTDETSSQQLTTISQQFFLRAFTRSRERIIYAASGDETLRIETSRPRDEEMSKGGGGGQ